MGLRFEGVYWRPGALDGPEIEIQERRENDSVMRLADRCADVSAPCRRSRLPATSPYSVLDCGERYANAVKN